MKKMIFFILIGLCLLALPIWAQINLLHEFIGGPADGAQPWGSLIVSGSTLYGMTEYGGGSDKGTIFKVQMNGTGFTLLHEFAGGTVGEYPSGALILSGSTLFGMTFAGGGSDNGTIFKVQTDGSGYILLHEFTGIPDDGNGPVGSLILSGSTLYGMTQNGGASDSGTIFKVQTNGYGYTLLHEFAGGATDGLFPAGELIISGSTLYGMTINGGDTDWGTVFKVQTDGSGLTLLHEFANQPVDGARPHGSLLIADSTLYGMTSEGGTFGVGTIFKVQTDSSGYSLLHEFDSSNGGGYSPRGFLIISGSTLYGTTFNCGGSDHGTIFSVQTDGSGFSVLHKFAGGADDGAYTQGSLILSDSTVYGMTLWGGDSDLGVIFSYSLYNDLYIFDGHDFNGDGGSDVSVFRPSNNFWYIKEVGSYQWGKSGDKPVSGDYDADGKTDVAIFRASTGKWIIRRSSTGTALSYTWGISGDVPVPGDYDKDGKTDVAVWRPSTGKWLVKGSAGTNVTISWGKNGDIPVPGDYDGDSKADMATFRASAGKWYIKGSNGTNYTYSWGQNGDTAVPADYDGDGKADAAIFRASAGKWYVKGSNGTNYTYTWGQSGDTPAPGDYDNDGKADVAIFRPSAGKWMIKGSAGTNFTYTWGANGDVALVK